MATRIDTVEARAKLKPRHSPYWHGLSTGCHVGYRKMSAGTAGTWLVQTYDAATHKQRRLSLGAFDHLPPGQRFDAAKVEAEKHAEHLGRGGRADKCTVGNACDDYVEHLRTGGRTAAADATKARFSRLVHAERLAGVDVRKLAPHHLRAWRSELASTPAIINGRAPRERQRTRPRAASTVNRDVALLRAALNHARRGGRVTTDAAWRDELRAARGAGRRRGLYLDRSQRIALVAAARPEIVPFLRALCLLPLRPGAMAALTVASFDKRLGVVTVGHDKSGADRRITLTGATAKFFAVQTNNKLPGALLLPRADGSMWTRTTWNRPIRCAAAAAGLPAETVAYSLRHAVITDLVSGGLDVLAVARLSGTSMQMIDAHYGHLVADRAATALATLAL